MPSFSFREKLGSDSEHWKYAHPPVCTFLASGVREFLASTERASGRAFDASNAGRSATCSGGRSRHPLGHLQRRVPSRRTTSVILQVRGNRFTATATEEQTSSTRVNYVSNSSTVLDHELEKEEKPSESEPPRIRCRSAAGRLAFDTSHVVLCLRSLPDHECLGTPDCFSHWFVVCPYC